MLFKKRMKFKCVVIQVFITVLILVAFSVQAFSKKSEFKATRDVWISAYPGEENYNMGAAKRLKLKGIQEMAILDFDLSPVRGKKIESARLYLKNAGSKNKLRKIGISTVANQWVEGASQNNSEESKEKGASFNYSGYHDQTWAGEGSDLSDVIMGSGNTIHHHTEIKDEGGGWWSIDIAPELIVARLINKSFGFLIMDESGQTFANNYVHSRESGNSSPSMVVSYSNSDKKKPQQPEVELDPSYEHAHMDSGAMLIKLRVQEDIFAYDIFLNGEEVPVWRVPRPLPAGEIEEIVLDWLLPGQKVNVKIMAVDISGQRSEPAFAAGYASQSLPEIVLPPEQSSIEHEQIKSDYSGNRPFTVWAVPDIAKIDPVSGQAYYEKKNSRFRKRNPVWSEKKNEVSLVGIKGEVIGFQLCIQGKIPLLDSFELEFTPLVSNEGRRIHPDRLSIYKVHYVQVNNKWYPEIAVPMNSGRRMKQSINSQTNQLIYVELFIPSDIEAAVYNGKALISKNGKREAALNVRLKVENIVMPRHLSFIPELNMYHGPAKAGTEKFYEAHRIAKEHRTVINRVPYDQDGTVHYDMVPEISYLKNGRVKIDWTEYDRNLGPLFDGTAFNQGERKGVPVEKFYLPFFENWPEKLAPNYEYKNEKNKSQGIISKHAMDAPALDSALSSVYKDRFIAVVKEFKRHFEEKGWDQTEFQFYLNNKWHWKGSSSWWNLDEPLSYDDWTALRYYGSLFRQAKNDTPLNFIFRADISMPKWNHDSLNRVLERMYVQHRALFRNPERLRKLAQKSGIDFSAYGSLNNIESSNQRTVFWCMRAYVEGADGVLSWQSLGGSSAVNEADTNALIIDARDATGIDWVVSLRMKALRRGQQNVELMAMLEKEKSYKREQIRHFFYKFIMPIKHSPGYDDNNDNRGQIDTYNMERFRRILLDMLKAP